MCNAGRGRGFDKIKLLAVPPDPCRAGQRATQFFCRTVSLMRVMGGVVGWSSPMPAFVRLVLNWLLAYEIVLIGSGFGLFGVPVVPFILKLNCVMFWFERRKSGA